MGEAHLIGTCSGEEIYARSDGMYFIRVKAENEEFSTTVNNLHRRIQIGRFDSFGEAMKAIKSRKAAK